MDLSLICYDISISYIHIHVVVPSELKPFKCCGYLSRYNSFPGNPFTTNSSAGVSVPHMTPSLQLALVRFSAQMMLSPSHQQRADQSPPAVNSSIVNPSSFVNSLRSKYCTLHCHGYEYANYSSWSIIL